MSVPVSKLKAGGRYASKRYGGKVRTIVHLGTVKLSGGGGDAVFIHKCSYTESGSPDLTIARRQDFARWADLHLVAEEAEG